MISVDYRKNKHQILKAPSLKCLFFSTGTKFFNALIYFFSNFREARHEHEKNWFNFLSEFFV